LKHPYLKYIHIFVYVNMNEHIHAFKTILNELNVIKVIIFVYDPFEIILFGLHDSCHVITMVLNISIGMIMQDEIV